MAMRAGGNRPTPRSRGRVRDGALLAMAATAGVGALFGAVAYLWAVCYLINSCLRPWIVRQSTILLEI